MRPVSRRSALLLGGLGTAGIAAGGAGLWWSLSPRYSPAVGTDFTQPGELRSSNGRLQVRLEAAPGTVQLGGGRASALAYNGGVPGPTLRVRAGDVLNVELVNSLAVPTNLHVHGLHVSPQGNGDNVFVTVDPGNSFKYEYHLPADHPPGVYWYHPHHHGMVADQVFAGLFGAIIVEDAEALDVSRERVLIISDITLDASGTIPDASSTDRMLGREGEIVLVNGQSTPKLSARPGERERWRIVNTCVARYLRLRLDGQQIQLLGMDSGRFRTPETVEELLLAPGNRADLLVTAAAGNSTFTSVFYDRGSMPGMAGPAGRPPAGQGQGNIALASLAVSGEPAGPPPPLPAQQEPEDLRTSVIAAHRQLTFAAGGMGMGRGGMGFTINGRTFDETRTDTTAAGQTVEEWTLKNSSAMDHPFHLHVWPMQIVEDRGKTPGSPLWQDVVNVPANGQVKVRIAFKDFTGRTVYHCHILDHEDNGMMGVIEVR